MLDISISASLVAGISTIFVAERELRGFEGSICINGPSFLEGIA
jgi:hypothetical protein